MGQMDGKLLVGLDAVDWESLEDAHGDAAEIPSLLIAVADARGDLEGCDAWSELGERLVEQDCVYSATEAAVPFLYELLERFGDQSPYGILSLLDRIAGNRGEIQDDDLLQIRMEPDPIDETKPSAWIGDDASKQ
jgi:hypothetical protein